MIVHILEHVLDADLLAVADAPHAVELQSLDNGTLEDEYCRGTRTADEINTLRVQVRDGQRKDAVMVAVQQSDAVGPDERRTVLLAGVEDTLLERRSLLCLLTEAGRDDDESPDMLLLAEIVYVVGTVFRSHDHDGKVCLGDVLHVVERLDTLHFIFLGVDDIQAAAEAAVDDITHNGTTGLMHVVGAANDDDAPWI